MARSLNANIYKDSYESRKSGGNRKGAMDWSKFDGDIKFYKAKEGKNKLSIVPYEIKTNNHPRVKKGKAEKGELDYVLDIFIHKNVGPAETAIICPKKNFGKLCPVCDEAEKLRAAGKADEYNNLKARRRCFYNVRDDMDTDAGVMVWEVSQNLFEAELIEEANTAGEDGKMVQFADPDDGKTIAFRGSMTKLGNNEYLEFKGFTFHDRNEEITDEMMVYEAVSFDALMILYSTEEIEKIMYGADEEEEEEEEKKPSTNKKPHVEEEDDEKEEEKSAKTKSKKEAPPVEEEKPIKCPKGHKFGKDWEETDDCDDCKLYKQCGKASK